MKRIHSLDYYIAQAQNSIKRSSMLWLCVNQGILRFLEQGKKRNLSVRFIAKEMHKQVGEKKTNEPVALGNWRTMAVAMLADEDIWLI